MSMCIAVPGKVVSLDGNLAGVDYGGNLVKAHAGLVDVRVGDSVLVHAGCIIQVLLEEDSNYLLELLSQMEGMR